MKVNGVYVLKELLAVFCLLEDKGVIHIPEPKPGVGGGADGLSFNLFHEQGGNQVADGVTIGCTMDLFKYFPWRRKQECGEVGAPPHLE